MHEMKSDMQTIESYATVYADRLVEDGVTIFLLHGVEDGVQTEIRNYNRKHIPKSDFEALVRGLKSHGSPVSMEMIVASRRGECALPPKAFALTFDDGFENNLTVAAPILEEHNVPAMFYVTTDFVESNRMSWIDRIEFAVEAVPKGSLELPWGTSHFSDTATKRALLEETRTHVKTTPSLMPDEIATMVQSQLGLGEVWASDHPLDQKMTWPQVKSLAQVPGCSIGGHTHTHPIMAFLDESELRHEIGTCLELLKTKGGVTCDHFSYPEGLEHCYNEQVIAVLKEFGILCSPSAIDGVNRSDIDLFNLYRVMVA